MSASLPKAAAVLVAVILVVLSFPAAAGATWCVARSDASDQALQTALDYACGAGADCTPIEPSGLCFLPNTLIAHASYAFNSYYQRKGMAPGSCDFSATATVAKTDPSYGSCDYPSSSSTAGGTLPPGTGTGTGTGTGPTTPTTGPTINVPPPPLLLGTSPNINNGGVNPGNSPVLPDAPASKASLKSSFATMLTYLSFFLIIPFIF